jgi:DNA-binding SARP family transcriptional activator
VCRTVEREPTASASNTFAGLGLTATRVSHSTESATLQLLGWWELRVGDQSIAIGRREQRLVALLALMGRRPRAQLAGILWPDTTDARAMASLRAAVWQVRRAADGLLASNGSTLALAGHVQVDVAELTTFAGLASGTPSSLEFDETMRVLQTGELLPGWYEDWVLFERERIQHLRLRALESLALTNLQAGSPHRALAAARTASGIEPLHEGAQLLLIRACLECGNVPEAVRHYQSYRSQLQRDLGVQPSQQLTDQVRPFLLPHQRHAAVANHHSRR